MRAGLLSDPRVVALLRTLFVPVHISALNTPHCMPDPRDVAVLQGCVSESTDLFLGGEREVFVLPDGTMQRVFLSLNGHAVGEYSSGAAQYTATGRRSEDATRMFRHYGSLALRALHDELPAAWRELWDLEHPAVVAVMAEAPRWPEAPAGRQGFRVFVRNSYRMYDDLHGSQLALLADSTTAAWGGALTAVESRSPLPRESFLALAGAIVPRGMVDTELAASSIAGALELVAERVSAGRVEGRVEGGFSLLPTDKGEVGKRPSAAALFESKGRLVGRFVWDREARTFVELRIVATDVQLAWLPVDRRDEYFDPRHQIGIEWVCGPAAVLR